jgi:preprotein translocase subunit SecF
MSRLGALGARLYHGEASYDFVGKRKIWYSVSAAIIVIVIAGLGLRGLNLGIEFKGGAEFQVKSPSVSVEVARNAAESTAGGEIISTLIGTDRVRVQTGPIDEPTSQKVVTALAKAFNVAEGEVKVQLVGPSWGGDITKKALQGLVVFLLLVIIFLAIYFEFKMAIAAMVALVHDVVITIGVYALVGFEVTPASVIGLLTILGYSLYDTVVVFDKVKENTRGIGSQTRRTYSGAANLALNQTLVRSINTSIVAILPVAAILGIGAGLLGAGTLKDLALALFVGMIAGTYSSIFVATPVLAQLKESEPAMQQLTKRVSARGGDDPVVARVGAAAASSAPAPRVQPRRQPKRKR